MSEPDDEQPKPKGARAILSNVRGRTQGEVRAMTFERWTRYVVLGTAVGAAAGSFLALMWIGQFMGWAAPLLPITVDGLIVAASMGIVHSHAENEQWWRRATRWFGLGLALGVSVWGNILHAQAQRIDYMPPVAVIVFGGVAPLFAAFGLHVYGLAMNTDTLSDNILADDPEHVYRTVWKPGDPLPAARPRSAPAPARPRAQAQTGPSAGGGADLPARNPRAIRAQPTSGSAPDPRAPADKGRAAIRASVLQILADDPRAQFRASDLRDRVGATADEATVRRWVATAKAEAATLRQADEPLMASI